MHVTAITDCHGVVSWKWFNISGQSKIHTNTFTTQYSNILSILLDVILNVLDDVCLKSSCVVGIYSIINAVYDHTIIKSCKNGYCVIIGNSELIGSDTLSNSHFISSNSNE